MRSPTSHVRLSAAYTREHGWTMVAIHLLLTRVIILYMLIAAGWGLFNAFRHRPATDSYRTTLLIGEALFVANARLAGARLLAPVFRRS